MRKKRRPHPGKLSRQLKDHPDEWVAVVGNWVIACDSSESKLRRRLNRMGAHGAHVRFNEGPPPEYSYKIGERVAYRPSIRPKE